MLITIYSFKGGEGKSKIAQAIALEMDYSIITNDVYSPIEYILPEEGFLKLREGDPIPKLNKDDDVIFDLGGYAEERVIPILTLSRWILVPVTNEKDNIRVAIYSIDEIQKYNSNILIIANKTEKGHFEQISKILNQYYSYPVFEVKKSKAFPEISETGKAISFMRKQNALKKYHYRKPEEQIQKIIKHIKGEQNGNGLKSV